MVNEHQLRVLADCLVLDKQQARATRKPLFPSWTWVDWKVMANELGGHDVKPYIIPSLVWGRRHWESNYALQHM